MPLSEIVNGEVLDWHFTKASDSSYIFSIGHIQIAQVWNMGGRKWTVVPFTPLLPHIYSGAGEGFRSRYDACAHVLKTWRAQQKAQR